MQVNSLVLTSVRHLSTKFLYLKMIYNNQNFCWSEGECTTSKINLAKTRKKETKGFSIQWGINCFCFGNWVLRKKSPVAQESILGHGHVRTIPHLASVSVFQTVLSITHGHSSRTARYACVTSFEVFTHLKKKDNTSSKCRVCSTLKCGMGCGMPEW